MSMRYKRHGWFGESHRHYLAAKGMSTAPKKLKGGYGGNALEKAFSLGNDRFSIGDSYSAGANIPQPVGMAGEEVLPSAFKSGVEWTPNVKDSSGKYLEGAVEGGKKHEGRMYEARKCPMCGGSGVSLGRLGTKDYLKCRNCGSEYQGGNAGKNEKPADFNILTGRGKLKDEATYEVNEEDEPALFAKKDIQSFIRMHRAEIDAHIKSQIEGPGTKIDNDERELWVMNDESLYNMARDEGYDV